MAQFELDEYGQDDDIGIDEEEERESLQDSLSAIVKAEINQSASYSESYINQQRSDAFAYFYGEKPAAKERRSSYVSRDVYSAVLTSSSILSSVFTSNNQVVRFDAMSPADAVEAKLANTLVNRCFYKRNNGYIYNSLPRNKH